MKTPDPTLLRLTQSFFQQYLQLTCGASPHTIRAYRDTLRMFFEFLAQQTHRSVDRLTLSDVTVQRVLNFLVHLEGQRGNRPVTRNCRLAALRSWAKHLLRHDPSNGDQYARILALPAKRYRQAPPNYLEPEQFRLVLDQALRNDGDLRDAALLHFLYNTGARVNEALQLRWNDLRRCYRLAQQRNPSLPKTSIHPHTLRHSCAVALLQAGIELPAIRDYLGHASIATTSRYLHTNLAMKRDVLNRFWKRAGLAAQKNQRWRPSAGLLQFLRSL